MRSVTQQINYSDPPKYFIDTSIKNIIYSKQDTTGGFYYSVKAVHGKRFHSQNTELQNINITVKLKQRGIAWNMQATRADITNNNVHLYGNVIILYKMGASSFSSTSIKIFIFNKKTLDKEIRKKILHC